MNDAHTYLGNAETGYGPQAVYLGAAERFEHAIVIGASGAGKSTLLRAIAAADVARGDGLLFLDSHGDDFELLLDSIPRSRHNHVAVIDMADLDWPVGLNVLEAAHPDDRALAADTLVAALRDVWAESWGPRLELILRHAALALLDVPGSTIAHIGPLLTNDVFRARVVECITNPLTHAFFTARFEEWRNTFRSEAIEPVLTRLDSVLSFPAILHALAQHRRTLSLEDAMQARRVILVNLARGVLGETGASLMGALLLARVRAAAMGRARIAPEERAPFHVIADEFATYASGSLAAGLAELRKFSVSITAATQLLSTLPDRTQAAILGTAGTLIAFRCSPEDGASIGAKFSDLHRDFNASLFNELGRGEAMVKIGGGDARRLRTPAPEASFGTKEIVRRQAHRHFARPRADVQEWIHKELRKRRVG